MTGKTFRNYSLQECDRRLAVHIGAITAGRMRFWQKFTCEKCWARITIEVPNKLFVAGHCQHCNHVTDLTKTGCNYLLMFSPTGPLPPESPT